MDKLRLIRITPQNRTVFYNLFAPPFDPAAKECTWLNSNIAALSQEQRIAEFMEAEEANILKPLHFDFGQESYLFQHDGAVPTPVPPVMLGHADYPDFIKKIRTMIAVELRENGKKAFVLMDPLPLGEEIAILFRPDEAQPWEFATAKTIPKTEYVEQLIAPYTNITGLPMQLGITQFADGTKVLNRFYMSDDASGNPVIAAATLHRIDRYGVAETVLTNEDFLIKSQFLSRDEWLEIEKEEHGEVVSFDRVTSGAQCAAFFRNDEGQFSISKTGNKDAAGRPIEKTIIQGAFLQIDRNKQPLIQSSARSVLEGLMYAFINQPAPAPPPPSPPPGTAGIVDHTIREPQITHWVGDDISKVTKTAAGVKIELSPTAHLVDTGKDLSLQGDVQEAYLRAMLQHAKEHWGGGFKIESCADADEPLLRRLAKEMKVTIVEPAGSTPSRPVPSPPPTARSAAPAQAA